MSARIAYVNGEFVPEDEARVSMFDRGFLFADAIYEATGVLNGRLVDHQLHLARLQRSAREIRMDLPGTLEEINEIQKELVRRNALREGAVFMQVTRGTAPRNFVFPKGIRPTLAMFVIPQQLLDDPTARTGIKVKSVPDLRWARRDIKTVNLLAQVLARQAAAEEDCQEAWMLDEDNRVTEAAASSAFIITQDQTIVTRERSQVTLEGCTQVSLKKLIAEHGLRLEERAFHLEEAYAAREAFITNATAFVMPVVAIDGRQIGDGRPGPLTQRLRQIYLDAAQS